MSAEIQRRIDEQRAVRRGEHGRRQQRGRVEQQRLDSSVDAPYDGDGVGRPEIDAEEGTRGGTHRQIVKLALSGRVLRGEPWVGRRVRRHTTESLRNAIPPRKPIALSVVPGQECESDDGTADAPGRWRGSGSRRGAIPQVPDRGDDSVRPASGAAAPKHRPVPATICRFGWRRMDVGACTGGGRDPARSSPEEHDEPDHEPDGEENHQGDNEKAIGVRAQNRLLLLIWFGSSRRLGRATPADDRDSGAEPKRQ